jgi:hypothetical protein
LENHEPNDRWFVVNKLGKDSVRDLGNNESEQTALAGNKGSSLCVGKVLEIGNRLPNAGGKHGVHRRNVVDGPRDCSNGYPDARCDSADIDPLEAPSAFLIVSSWFRKKGR